MALETRHGPEIRGLVLDMDGTLVDSEPLSMQAWNELLTARGAPALQSSDFERFVGISSLETARTILCEHATAAGLAAPEADDVTHFTTAKRSLLVTKIFSLTAAEVDELWFDGVRPLLAQLHDTDTVQMALCTSADAEQVQALVDREPQKVGAKVFGLRVTRDHVEPDQMKPSAAPYERAAALLGLPVSRCTAVEDSVAGVSSAAAAGYGSVLGVLSTVQTDDEAALQGAAKELKDAGATEVFRNTCLALQSVLEAHQ